MLDWVPWIRDFWGLLKRAQDAEAALAECRQVLQDLLAEADSLRAALSRTEATRASPEPALGIPAPSPDAHFLNHFWACLWLERKPIPVFRYPDCALSSDEVWQALSAWNALASKASGGKLDRFFNLLPGTVEMEYGVLLYGAAIPPTAMQRHHVPSPFHLSVVTKRYLRDSEMPWKANEQRRWALDCRPGESTVLALAHEMGHILGLSDHYYLAGPENDGKEGMYEGEAADSIMANTEWGIRPHDIEDLTELYTSPILRFV